MIAKHTEVWIRSSDEATVILDGRSNGNHVKLTREDFDALLIEAGYHKIG